MITQNCTKLFAISAIFASLFLVSTVAVTEEGESAKIENIVVTGRRNQQPLDQ